MPVIAKIGGQKHLFAIRNAFVSIMTVTMIGSIAVLKLIFNRSSKHSVWYWK